MDELPAAFIIKCSWRAGIVGTLVGERVLGDVQRLRQQGRDEMVVLGIGKLQCADDGDAKRTTILFRRGHFGTFEILSGPRGVTLPGRPQRGNLFDERTAARLRGRSPNGMPSSYSDGARYTNRSTYQTASV